MDYRRIQWLFRNKDIHEGIRAILVDHDNTPVWIPGSLDEVTDEMVNSYFQPLAPEKELLLLDHRLQTGSDTLCMISLNSELTGIYLV